MLRMSQPATNAAPAPTDSPSAPAAPATRLLLVRHAVTEQTGPLLSGRLPGIDLSARGVEQATAVAGRLAALPVGAVYASPIERTTQTAQHIAARHALTVCVLPGVIEADYGEWTGGAIAELAKTDTWKVVQRAPSRARFPGGESIREMQARTVAALEQVLADHPNQTIVVVSHADPIKAAIAHFTGMHLDLFQRLHVSPASVTVFEFNDGSCMLLKCNDTGGLEELHPGEPQEQASDG
jgi:probable phosphoglycerate mutase